MHYLMLVTLSMPDGTTSEKARWAVQDRLLHDDSFCGDGGQFGSPLCDWFVIGGRWSGLLAQTTVGDIFKAALTTRFPELTRKWTPESLAERHAAEFDSLWIKCGGTGSSPYTRTSYEVLGYTDDAMVLTPQLYEAHLAAYQGRERVSDGSHCEFVDLNFQLLDCGFVGHKWLVVVDYHN